MKIYHYTTIETLALILKNKTIRFNRLDKVDDLEEGSVAPMGIKLGHYAYISCWTESEEENIPLWKMYATGSSGIRITFDFEPFKDYEIRSTQEVTIENSPCYWKLPLSEVMNPNYFIFPWFQGDTFYRKVLYVNNVIDQTKDIITEENGSTNISFKKIGSYKHTRWAFQLESRFILIALPKINGLSYSSQNFSDWLLYAIHNNIKPPFDYYDLPLKDSALSTLEITLTPAATICQKIIVQSLINEYAPKAILKDSNLMGSVNLK